MALPAHAKYVVIGAGVHGLSTAYHLAEKLEATGKGSGKDIVILDKTGVAAGASGIACGVIRNNYFQPAMRELMAECVAVWESDPKAFSYNAVGYMQISPEVMHENVGQIARQQKDIGYDSVFIEGEADCTKYMKGLFDDWQAKGITSVLHEKKGGYANNRASMMGLAKKAEDKGVSIISPVRVKGFTFASNSKAVTGIDTDRGTIGCDYVVVGVGPWINQIWNMLDLPKTVDIKGRDGKTHKGVGMWTYWCLEEGTLGVDPKYGLMNDGRMGPVMHVDTDAPLHSDEDGSLITDKLWGIYYKPDFNFNGIQGGAMPYKVETPVDEVKIDPYGPESPEFIVDKNFAHMFTSALAFCQKRYSGQAHMWKHEPSGGLGCFTPDSFPVFDVFRDNVYVLADSNHGYKMIAVGKLAAGEIVSGRKSRLLEPFRISRFPEGRLHPVSNSPFPWS